jgi:hypothetical protein
MQMGSWHEILLTGGRTSSVQFPQINGNNGLYNTRILNTNNSIALVIQGDTGGGQTANLTQWWNTAGNTISSVSASGDFFIGSSTPSTNTTTGALRVIGGVGVNGSINLSGDVMSRDFLLHGQDFYSATSTAGSSTASTTPQTKIALTTGNLLGGTYCIFASYVMASNTNNRTWQAALTLDGTTLITDRRSAAVSATDAHGSTLSRFTPITSGTHGVNLTFNIVTSGHTVTISQSRVWLYRIDV